jgi:hypothetical protein
MLKRKRRKTENGWFCERGPVEVTTKFFSVIPAAHRWRWYSLRRISFGCSPLHHSPSGRQRPGNADFGFTCGNDGCAYTA